MTSVFAKSLAGAVMISVVTDNVAVPLNPDKHKPSVTGTSVYVMIFPVVYRAKVPTLAADFGKK